MEQKKQSYLAPFIIMVVLMSLVGLITSLNQQFQAPMKAAYLLLTGSWSNTFSVLIVFSFFLAYLVIGPISASYIDKNGYKNSLILGLFILIASFGLFELSAYLFDTVDFKFFQTYIDEAKNISSLYKNGSQELINSSVAQMNEIAERTGNFLVQTAGERNEFSGLVWKGALHLPIAYYVFIIASFVAGTSLTFLQAVINPYIVACNVKGTSGVQRQSIAGAGNSMMTTLGPILVSLVIFSGKSGLEIKITSLYVPILVLIILVGIIIYGLNRVILPTIASTEKKKDEVLPDSVWSFRHLSLGVVAIFFYVGVEVCVGSNINLYAIGKGFDLPTAAKMATFYWGGMLVGRLCGSFLSKVSANIQLAVTSIVAAVLVLISMVTGNPWILVGVGLFHSIMWPAIFDLAIAKLGRYTSKGSGALMMGVVGGAILPLVQAIATDKLFNGDWTLTWIIVIAGEAYLLFYALLGHKVLKSDEIR